VAAGPLPTLAEPLDPERLRELSAVATAAAEQLAGFRTRATAAEERAQSAEQQEQATRQQLQAQLQAAQQAMQQEQQARALLGKKLQRLQRDADSRVAASTQLAEAAEGALQGERAARQQAQQQLQAARQRAEAGEAAAAAALERCEGLQLKIRSKELSEDAFIQVTGQELAALRQQVAALQGRLQEAGLRP
jgi:chromosome segregation ATPase